jgi:signal transduction histidine kinase
MLSKTRFRWTELLIAVAVVAAALVWAERTAWRQISSLREEMTTDQIARFRSADALRAAILGLHNVWRRSIEETNTTNRTHVEANSRKTRELIQAMASKAGSPAETQLSKEIADAFEEYLGRVSRSLDALRITPETTASRVAEQGVETGLERLLDLSEKLTTDNRSAAEHFVTDANAALTRLQRFLFVALLGLLISGTAIVALIYRRTIAPLRSNLTESRAIIERQEKLSSLGVFAAGIAHEVRNPLTAIKVRLFTLKSSHKPGTSEHEDLEVIRNEIDRLERIVRDFLQFARPAEPELQTMPVEQLLRDVHELLQSDLAGKSVELKLELQAKEPIRVDPNKMKQVLINFVQNGAESMEAGGTVTLRSRMDKQVLNGRHVTTVVIDVADTGKGIPPEVQKRLFDPFFTTKEAGTGLGLPIAARIVEKHGGVIQYQTHPNRGTTFSIVLPIAPKNEIQS